MNDDRRHAMEERSVVGAGTNRDVPPRNPESVCDYGGSVFTHADSEMVAGLVRKSAVS